MCQSVSRADQGSCAYVGISGASLGSPVVSLSVALCLYTCVRGGMCRAFVCRAQEVRSTVLLSSVVIYQDSGEADCGHVEHFLAG